MTTKDFYKVADELHEGYDVVLANNSGNWIKVTNQGFNENGEYVFKAYILEGKGLTIPESFIGLDELEDFLKENDFEF